MHALYWLTANLAAAQPLLLAVDDAHWADTGSLRFLHFLARRISELPVALVVATRPFVESAESAPILGALLGLTEAPLRPAPLGETAVAELIRERFGEEPKHDFVTACISARRTGTRSSSPSSCARSRLRGSRPIRPRPRS